MNRQTSQLVNFDGRVITGMQHRVCPQCDTPFGKRKACATKDTAGNTIVVHAKCLNNFNHAVQLAISERLKAEERTKQERAEAIRAANKVRRGWDLKKFIDSVQSKPKSEVTDEEKAEWSLAYELNYLLKAAKETMDDFHKKLDSDPLYALSWSDRAFRAAARLAVCSEIQHYFLMGTPIQDIQDTLVRDVVRATREPAHSTSPTSNLANEAVASVKAQLLDRIIGPATHF